MKNTLINFSKNYNFLFLLLGFSSLCSMDGMNKLMRVFNPEPYYILRKESQFDSLKLHEIKPWYENLSKKQKKGILNKICTQNKGNQALFRVAVQLPSDIQKIVIAHMFAGYSYTDFSKKYPNKYLGEYENAVNKFYEKPIITAFKAANFIEFLKDCKKRVEKLRQKAGSLHVGYIIGMRV